MMVEETQMMKTKNSCHQTRQNNNFLKSEKYIQEKN